MRKGFTLVELLVVIVIIGMLSFIAYPSIISIIKNSKDSTYRSQIKIMEKITKEWATSNPMKLPKIEEHNGECYCDSKCITIDSLKDSGYLSNEDVKNPKGGDLTGGVEIKCTCSGSCNTCKYEYEYKPAC